MNRYTITYADGSTTIVEAKSIEIPHPGSVACYDEDGVLLSAHFSVISMVKR